MLCCVVDCDGCGVDGGGGEGPQEGREAGQEDPGPQPGRGEEGRARKHHRRGICLPVYVCMGETDMYVLGEGGEEGAQPRRQEAPHEAEEGHDQERSVTYTHTYTYIYVTLLILNFYVYICRGGYVRDRPDAGALMNASLI